MRMWRRSDMVTLGIDAGTQSIKVLIYDSEKKETLAVSQAPVDLIVEDGGVREQKASWWIDALDSCMEKIPAEIRGRVEAIAVSGQQHGFVPVAADGRVLHNVKLWCDTSTQRECDEMMASAGGAAEVQKRTGNRVMTGYTAGKILYLRKHFPKKYAEMKYVLLPHDYLNYFLTGVAVMERGDASGTGLMNIFTGEWDRALCDAIADDLMTKLPRIVQEPKAVGPVTREIAARYSLPESCIVTSGGGDNMMSAIGTGAVTDGHVTMSLGTSGTLFASSSVPVSDEKGRLAAFCSSHGTYLPLLCTMNCTVATEVMRKYMGDDVIAFGDKASRAPRGAGGLVFLPFLNGERVPNLPHGEGVIGGMNPGNISDENIARATFEGVTYEFLLGLDAFREKGAKVTSIQLTGGGSKSPFWRQLVADMTGLPVRVPSSSEAAAFGSALQALWIAGGGELSKIVEEHLGFDSSKETVPDMKAHGEYMELYRRWNGYVEALSPLFR